MVNQTEEIIKKIKEINELENNKLFLGLDIKDSGSIKSSIGWDSWKKWYAKEQKKNELIKELHKIY